MKPKAPNIGVSNSFDFRVRLTNECESAEFLDQTIPNLDILKQSPEYSQTNYIPFEEFTYDPKDNYRLDCG